VEAGPAGGVSRLLYPHPAPSRLHRSPARAISPARAVFVLRPNSTLSHLFITIKIRLNIGGPAAQLTGGPPAAELHKAAFTLKISTRAKIDSYRFPQLDEVSSPCGALQSAPTLTAHSGLLQAHQLPCRRDCDCGIRSCSRCSSEPKSIHSEGVERFPNTNSALRLTTQVWMRTIAEQFGICFHTGSPQDRFGNKKANLGGKLRPAAVLGVTGGCPGQAIKAGSQAPFPSKSELRNIKPKSCFGDVKAL
jgi:hypothetical protein